MVVTYTRMGGSSFNMISSVSVMGIDSFTSGDTILMIQKH